MAIKFKLKVVLAEREMTQKELAIRTGVRPTTISGIATGVAKHIPVNVLDSICNALQCQPGDLLVYTKESSE